MTKATLSVIICNYNHAQFIPTAIEAVVSQSRRPDEFIIMDDASTDESVEIIKRCISTHPWIRLVKNDKNLGPNAAIVRAIEMASGTHVYSGAADDFVLPGFFEQAMRMAEQYPEAGFVAGKWTKVDEFGRPFPGAEAMEVAEWKEADYISPERYLREYLLKYPPLHTSSLATIYHRRHLAEVGGFRGELGFFCDTFATRAIALKHGCCYLPQLFACWRQLHSSWSHTAVRNPKTLLDVRARCLWLMRHSDLKERFHEEYNQPWADAFFAFALQTAIEQAREFHQHWQASVFTMIPRKSALDRIIWWAVCRLSLASRKISLVLLRKRITEYEGDTSCYNGSTT